MENGDEKETKEEDLSHTEQEVISASGTQYSGRAESYEKTSLAEHISPHLQDTDGKLEGSGEAGDRSIHSLANFSHLAEPNDWYKIIGRNY